jgi:hypothetical protein
VAITKLFNLPLVNSPKSSGTSRPYRSAFGSAVLCSRRVIAGAAASASAHAESHEPPPPAFLIAFDCDHVVAALILFEPRCFGNRHQRLIAFPEPSNFGLPNSLEPASPAN